MLKKSVNISKKNMNQAIFYLGLAISGTGQQGKTEIDSRKLKNWLDEFAKKFFGQAWKMWLKDIGLETKDDIESVVIEYLEIYHRREVL